MPTSLQVWSTITLPARVTLITKTGKFSHTIASHGFQRPDSCTIQELLKSLTTEHMTTPFVLPHDSIYSVLSWDPNDRLLFVEVVTMQEYEDRKTSSVPAQPVAV